MQTTNTHEDETTVKCDCCGGLCPAHKEDPNIAITYNEAIDDYNDIPGCWGCCGSGCRACKNTGKIPLTTAIKYAQLSLDRSQENVEKKQNILNDLLALQTKSS